MLVMDLSQVALSSLFILYNVCAVYGMWVNLIGPYTLALVKITTTSDVEMSITQ